MKKIVLSISNSLLASFIDHSLKQNEDFQVILLRNDCSEIARECADVSADILLMEAAFQIGTTLDDCLKEANQVRCLCTKCRVIMLCDDNSAPEVARKVAMSKKDGLIDDFVYSSVSASYLSAMLHAI